MKRLIFLTVIIMMFVSLSGLFATNIDVDQSTELGYNYASMNLINRTDWNGSGAVFIYYDDTVHSMVIRLASPGGTTHYYCYKNDNPELYGIVLTFVQSCLNGYVNRVNKNNDTTFANGDGYFYINIWYTSGTAHGGKNIIKGVGTTAS